MASIAWLLERGFRPVGEWTTSDSLVHRVAWLRRQAGIYAFTFADEVRCIGKATKLHSRIRNYSRRSFRDTKLALRKVHRGIERAIAAGQPVAVYAMPLQPGDARSIEVAEAALIREAQPSWNVSLVRQVPSASPTQSFD